MLHVAKVFLNWLMHMIFDGHGKTDMDVLLHPLFRYHLYVGNACPWCHRVLLALAILGLDRYITFTWLLDDAERASRGGWIFDPSTGTDPVFGAKDLKCAAFVPYSPECGSRIVCCPSGFACVAVWLSVNGCLGWEALWLWRLRGAVLLQAGL